MLSVSRCKSRISDRPQLFKAIQSEIHIRALVTIAELTGRMAPFRTRKDIAVVEIADYSNRLNAPFSRSKENGVLPGIVCYNYTCSRLCCEYGSWLISASAAVNLPQFRMLFSEKLKCSITQCKVS